MIRKLFKRFGIGLVPVESINLYEDEGVICFEEGIYCKVDIKHHKETRRNSHRRFIGALLITNKRFVVFSSTKEIINTTFDRSHFIHDIESTISKLIINLNHANKEKEHNNIRITIGHTTAPQIHSILKQLI